MVNLNMKRAINTSVRPNSTTKYDRNIFTSFQRPTVRLLRPLLLVKFYFTTANVCSKTPRSIDNKDFDINQSKPWVKMHLFTTIYFSSSYLLRRIL